jgi:hypothetical protein
MVSQNFQYALGSWGTTGAGKTAYWASLINDLRGIPNWTLEADPSDAANANIFLDRVIGDLGIGILPEPTITNTTYRFLLHGEDGDPIPLVFHDYPGEAILDRMGLFEELSQCTGILCIIDPDVSGLTQNEPILRLIERLFAKLPKTKGKLNSKVAMVLTKMDKPKHRAGWDNPEKYLREVVLNGPTWNAITNVCHGTKLKCFAVSAVGEYVPVEDQTISNMATFYWPNALEWRSEIQNINRWVSKDILPPVDWLLNDIGLG